MRSRLTAREFLAVCIAFAVAGWFLSGCPKQVVRDASVYQAEVDFMGMVVAQQSQKLEAFIKAECSCREDASGTILWVGDDRDRCQESAVIVQAVRARVPWHLHMMLYNAGLIEERPDENPPDVAPDTDLCPSVAPHQDPPDDPEPVAGDDGDDDGDDAAEPDRTEPVDLENL